MRLRGAKPKTSTPVDWLVVGLGNPGSRYERTPHNVGFQVAELLAQRWGLSAPRATFNGILSDGRAGTSPDGTPGPRVAVLRPQTFMNESGKSAGPARGALRVELDHVIVLHDELDLRFGDIRTRLGGGLAGHNGLKSLKANFGSPDFHRVRIGIGRPDTTDPEIVSAHVLGRWKQTEQEVGDLVHAAADAAEAIIFAPPEDAADA